MGECVGFEVVLVAKLIREIKTLVFFIVREILEGRTDNLPFPPHE